MFKAFMLMIGLLFANQLRAEAILGGNYLNYSNEEMSGEHSYKGWLSIYEALPSDDRFGLAMYGSHEVMPIGDAQYGEFKPYYEVVKNRFKIDVEYIHDSLKDRVTQDYIRNNRVGVGFEYKLWQ